MLEVNKAAIAAGIAASTLFIGYCIYFDNKRRSDPDYKRKVRERMSYQIYVLKKKKKYLKIILLQAEEDVKLMVVLFAGECQTLTTTKLLKGKL